MAARVVKENTMHKDNSASNTRSKTSLVLPRMRVAVVPPGMEAIGEIAIDPL